VTGDRVFLMDERINLDQEIRVQAVKTTYDERDNIIGCEVTFGSESIRQRDKASINSLSKNFQDLIEGKLKLPIISLEQIGMDMIKNITMQVLKLYLATLACRRSVRRIQTMYLV